MLADGRCVCPIGEFDDGSDCVACAPECDGLCYNTGPENCIKCAQGFGKNSAGVCVPEETPKEAVFA